MPDSVPDILIYATGALFMLAVLFLAIALRLFRRSRRDVFWRRRREAGQRGWRLFVLAFVLLAFSGLTCVATVVLALVGEDEPPPVAVSMGGTASTPSPPLTGLTQTPPERSPAGIVQTTEPSPAAFATEPPSSPTPLIVIVTSTPGVSPTSTFFPTFTPELPPLTSSVTPHPAAQIRITALDDQISDVLAPVRPRTTFPAGTTRLFLFVEFEHMEQGVLWKRYLYRDGKLVDGNSYLWGLETDGTGYFFFGSDDGFAPGQYEIRLYIGDSPVPTGSMTFTISENP